MPVRGLLIALFLIVVSPASEPRCAIHVESLVYPPTARLAHVAGDVHLVIKIDSEGRVESVNTASGNSMLRLAAEQNVKTWRFQSDRTEEMKITYHFKIEGTQTDDSSTVC